MECMSEVQAATSNPKSQLSKLLDECPVCPENPFADFSRHGFEPDIAITDYQKRDLTVILTALQPIPQKNDESKRQITGSNMTGIKGANVPITVPSMDICVRQVPGLTVRQVLGYICWLYTNQGCMPQLKGDVDAYVLNIADPDGEVEWDLPGLDNHELFSRYGFEHVSLVSARDNLAHRERNRPLSDKPGNTDSMANVVKSGGVSDTIKVVLPDGTKLDVKHPANDATVREFVDSVLEDHQKSVLDKASSSKQVSSKSKFYKSRVPLCFNLEAKNKPGVPLDPTAPFFGFRGSSDVFYIVRENSRRYSSQSDLVNLERGGVDDSGGGEDAIATLNLNDSIRARTHKEFHGLQRLTAKLRIKSEVTMSISNEKVNIYPSKRHSQLGNGDDSSNNTVPVEHFLSPHPKNESYSLDDIVNCEVIVKKSNIPGSKTPNSKYRLRLLILKNSKSGDKSLFDSVSIPNTTEELRKVDFECNMEMAKEIESKLTHLLSYPYSSQARLDYLESITKKIKKK